MSCRYWQAFLMVALSIEKEARAGLSLRRPYDPPTSAKRIGFMIVGAVALVNRAIAIPTGNRGARCVMIN